MVNKKVERRKKGRSVWTEGNRERVRKKEKEARGKEHKRQEGLEVCIDFGIA